MALSARPADPCVVVGELERYRCKTIQDVDHALTILTSRMRLIADPALMGKHLADRDALIERRLVLMKADG